jgi:hypothetical protein
MDPAGRNSLGIFLEITAPPAQLAAGSAPQAFAQTVGQACAYIVGSEPVQVQSAINAMKKLQSHAK